MPVDPSITARRHAAQVHRVASRYLNADLLHNPSNMPNVGDRVLRIEMSDSGVIEVLFENGESFHLVTGIHFEALDSDTREWQERTLRELGQGSKSVTPEDLEKSARVASQYFARKRATRLAREYLARR